MAETICPALCTQAQFARLIGVSVRRVTAMVAEGLLLTEDRKILAQESLRRYVASLEKAATERMTDSELALRKARAGRVRAEGELLENRLRREQDQIVTLEEAQEGWHGLCHLTRRLFEELPGRMAAALPGRLTAHDRKVMVQITRDAQTRLAEELKDGHVPGSNGPEDLLPSKEPRK